jgi:predicted metal-dependent peptidase
LTGHPLFVYNRIMEKTQMDSPKQPPREKLSETIVRFFETYPLYYIMLTSIARVETKAIPTMGVGFDSQNLLSIFYNPDFVAKLNEAELKIVLNHECQHLGLRHLDRGRSTKYAKDHELANTAMDVVVNNAITEFAATAPALFKTAMTADKFKSLQGIIIRDHTWEQIFDLIKEEVDKEKEKFQQMLKDAMDSHENWEGKPQPGAGQEGEGQPQPSQGQLTPEQQMALDGLMKEAVQKLGARDPGNVPGALRREIEELRKVRFDWRRTLSIFAQTVCQEERISTWKKVNRRLGLISPGHRKEFKPNILCVVDNSGSIGKEIYELFVAHMLKVAETCGRVDGIGVDTRVNVEFAFEKGKIPKLLDLSSGGGTEFQPAFDYAKKKGDYNGIIYFTDGYNFDTFTTHRIPVIFALCPGAKEVAGHRNIRIDKD